MFRRSNRHSFLWERNHKPLGATFDLGSFPEETLPISPKQCYLKTSEEIEQEISLCDKILNKRKRNPPLFIKRLPSVKRSNRFTLNALGSIAGKRKKVKYSTFENSPAQSHMDVSIEFSHLSKTIMASNISENSPIRLRTDTTSLSRKSQFITSSLGSISFDQETQPDKGVMRKARRRVLISSYGNMPQPKKEKPDILNGAKKLHDIVRDVNSEIRNIIDDAKSFANSAKAR